MVAIPLIFGEIAMTLVSNSRSELSQAVVLRSKCSHRLRWLGAEGVQVQLRRKADNPNIYRDEATGLEFERFTNEVPARHWGLRAGLNGEGVCHCYAKWLPIPKGQVGGIIRYEINEPDLKRIFHVHMNRIKFFRDNPLIYEDTLPLLLEGWRQLFRLLTAPGSPGDFEFILVQ